MRFAPTKNERVDTLHFYSGVISLSLYIMLKIAFLRFYTDS